MIKMWHFLSFCCYEENVSMFDISKGIYKQVNLQKYSIKSGLLMRLICNCLTSALQMGFGAIVKGTSNKLYRKNVDTTRTKMVRVHKGIPSGWDGDEYAGTSSEKTGSTRVSHPDGTETLCFALWQINK